MSRKQPLRIKAPPFSRPEIIQQAENLAKRYARAVEPEEAFLGISFDAVYDQIIYPEYEIELIDNCDLGVDEFGDKILGEYDVDRNTAYIDAILHPTKKDPRRAFTCWHEVGGHGVLQGEWLRHQLNQTNDRSRVITTEASLDLRTTAVLENQANLFASYAGAPTWLLYHVINETFNLTRPIRFIGPAKYCLDIRNQCMYYDVEDFNDLCRVIARQIQFRFGWLSIEALSYRIEQLSVIVDMSPQRFRLRRTAPKVRPLELASIQ